MKKLKYVKTFESYNMDQTQKPVSSWTESERGDLENLGADEIGRNTAVFRNNIEVNKQGFAKGGIKFEGGDGETLIINVRKYSQNETMSRKGAGINVPSISSKMSGRIDGAMVQAPVYTASSNAYKVAPSDDGSLVSMKTPMEIVSNNWIDFKQKLDEFINNYGIYKRDTRFDGDYRDEYYEEPKRRSLLSKLSFR